MNNRNTKQLVVDAMLIALLVVSSFISIPVNQIPYTLQTLAVFLILLITNLKNSFCIFTIYLLMGTIGLPVYSGFTSGITLTYGFIIGFVLSSLVFNIFKKIIIIKKDNIKLFILCFISCIIINISGSIFFMIYSDCDFITALLTCVLPFVLVDILKIIIAIIISKRINKILLEEY